jgi:4-amino-4-deoxy-L-arabinose transferase-like glycosyltransferase
MKRQRRVSLYLIFTIALMLFALLYSIINVGGPSFYGDDTTYLELAYTVLTHTFRESPYIFSVRLLQIYPIAFFYYLFGINMISASLWDIISYVLTIGVVFWIGKELYNEEAGFISALLFTFFPLVVRLSATISDDIPMMFVTSLAVLAMVLGEIKNSRLWYFSSGVLALAPPIVTPEGAIIVVFLLIFFVIEILRRKIKLKQGIYAIVGFLFAGFLLMLANYALSGNPLITLTVNSHFYSAVGGKNTIPSTNTNLNFYPSTMFPYMLISLWSTSLKSGNFANAFSFLSPSVFVPNSRVGFYFYTLIIAIAYLLVKRERRAYVPLLWFAICFTYLELGPMHVSLHPFYYLLSYRLGRFLTIIAPPTALLLGFAIERAMQKGSKIKRAFGIVVGIGGVVFLIATSIPINLLWHEGLVAQRYDQIAIAQYLNKLPSTTKIYMSGFASLVEFYMKYSNLTRFYAYDSIYNCNDIPTGAYAILPYFELWNLTYTANPSGCRGWVLVYAPQPNIPSNSPYKTLIQQWSFPFEARLYYVGGENTTISNATSTTTVTTSISTSTSSTYTPSKFTFFNLTGVGFYNTTNKLQFIQVNNVTQVIVSLNKSTATPGEYVQLNVTFVGNFLWSNTTIPFVNATVAYLASPIINIHYYGVELANQTGNLLVQNNGPWQKYVTQIGEPHQTLSSNPHHYLNVIWTITPNATMTGKVIKICGGYFATYQNTTLEGGWGSLYNILALQQKRVVNNSVINIPSENCTYLNVA